MLWIWNKDFTESPLQPKTIVGWVCLALTGMDWQWLKVDVWWICSVVPVVCLVIGDWKIFGGYVVEKRTVVLVVWVFLSPTVLALRGLKPNTKETTKFNLYLDKSTRRSVSFHDWISVWGLLRYKVQKIGYTQWATKFLATLVALHFTPVSKSVGQS